MFKHPDAIRKLPHAHGSWACFAPPSGIAYPEDMEIRVPWVLSWIQTISFNIPVLIRRNNATRNMQRQTCLWISMSAVVRLRTLFSSYSSMICTTFLAARLMNPLGSDPTQRKSARNFTYSLSNSRVSRSHFSQPLSPPRSCLSDWVDESVCKNLQQIQFHRRNHGAFRKPIKHTVLQQKRHTN